VAFSRNLVALAVKMFPQYLSEMNITNIELKLRLVKIMLV
jgi:hypothetical protein